MNFRSLGIILCLLVSVTFIRAQAFQPTGQISDDCFNCLCEKYLVNCSKTQPYIAKEYKQNCDVCNPLSANKTHNFQILIERSPSGSSRHFVVKMIVNSSNADGNGTHLKMFEVKLPVRAEVALAVRGISIPEVVSYNQSQKLIDNKISEIDIGPEILHVYEIENKGPTEVQEAEVYILWPTYTSEGKALLYLMDQPEVQGKAQCKVIDANPLKLQVMRSHNVSIPELKQQLLLSEFKDDDIEMGNAIFKRKKREDIASFLSLNGEDNTLNDEAEEAFQEELSCGQSLCTKIHCRVLNLQKDDQVIFSIRARLWRETYNEIGEKELMTSSKLFARITALPNGANVGHLPYKEYVVSTKVNLLSMSGRGWWVLGLSICCSISVIALLILLSWKLGFFKRKILQDKEPLNDRNGYRIASEDAAL